jgi:hypothetical protein
VITGAQHEDLKHALRALNARLVELDDRVPDDAEDARESLTSAWRAFAGVVEYWCVTQAFVQPVRERGEVIEIPPRCVWLVEPT